MILQTARDDLKKIEVCEEELKKKKARLAHYFCEKPDKFKLSECFQIILDFRIKFKKAAHENEVREEKQKKR